MGGAQGIARKAWGAWRLPSPKAPNPFLGRLTDIAKDGEGAGFFYWYALNSWTIQILVLAFGTFVPL